MSHEQNSSAKSSRRWLRSAWMIVIMLLLGAVLGYGFGRLFRDDIGQQLKSTPWLFQSLVFSLPLTYFVVVGWHELGHVVGGWLVGFEFNCLIVGPFKIERKAGKIGFAWNRSLNLAGGLALMLPRDVSNLRWRCLACIVGGPIASLVLVAICHLFSNYVFAGSPVSVLCDVLKGFSFLIFLATIVPLNMGGMDTDGRQVLNLLNEETSDVSVAMLTAIAHGQSGGRPRDLDLEILTKAIASIEKPDSRLLSLHYYAYMHLVDAGEIEASRPHLDAVVTHMDVFPKGLRESLWLIPAFHAAFYDRDITAAQAFHAKYKPSTFSDEADEFRMNAAMAALEGDVPAMQEAIQKARESLAKLMAPGHAPYYRECLDELQRRVAMA
ncbi:MAG: hypothetical protein AAF497_06910 [Planctomycetota bacterium]